MATAVELVRGFRRLRALVIGDAMLDTYLEGTAARLCSEGPVPVVRKTLEHRIPGGAANTAANVHALDADVMLLATIGNDLAGRMLREILRESGIGDHWLVKDASCGTLHKLRILADDQYVVRFDEGGPILDSDPANVRDTQQLLLRRLEEAYSLCDLVIISDYRYGVVSEALLERLSALLRAQPKVLLVDSKALQRFRDVPATVVTPNLLEARLLVEHMQARETNFDLALVEQVAQRMLEMLATEHVAITLAERGVFLLDRQGKKHHLLAHPVEHAHDVGAGDSFAAALALALAAGATIDEAARIGIDAASIAITRRWTSVVPYQELLQRVSLRDYAAESRSLDGRSRKALTQLTLRLEVERATGRRVVFTNGVFDILHAGHVRFLRQAKALGDVLVVGVNSDRSAQQLKGKGRPINSERDRMALVTALDAVDHVVLFDEETPAELIRVLRPDIHVKGGDYADEELPEAEAVREVGGQLVILPLLGTLSTSGMINRIVALASHEEDDTQVSAQGESL